MLMWIATKMQSKEEKAAGDKKSKLRFAAPSRPKLQDVLTNHKKAEDGNYKVEYVDIGKLDKEKVCKLVRGIGYVDTVKESMTLVREKGVVRKKRGS